MRVDCLKESETMEEIKVGEYVRLVRSQGIRKIEEIEDDIYTLDDYIIDEYGECTNYLRKSEKDMIIKHSPNIIDVIEVGDYVNDYKIFRIDVIDGEKVFKINECSFTEFLRTWKNKDIKSIVTHESFNSIKYEVI